MWVWGGGGGVGGEGGGKRGVNIEVKIAYLKFIKKSKSQYDHNNRK